MAGFNSIPAASGGGGGIPSMNFIGSIDMLTYNRSWALPGEEGEYAVYSANQESGYAYFVGTGTTTGIPLNRMKKITHSFSRLDIVAPQGDLISVYKVKSKGTTEFLNPFAAFSSFPAVIRSSGNFVLPNSALPLVNVVVAGAGGTGGHGNHNHAGGGGAGGAVVKLTAYQAVGTTGVTVGGGNSNGNQGVGGTTYFGSVYALGGGGGGHGGGHGGGAGGNGGGAGGGGGHQGGTGTTQTSSTGLGSTGAPAFYGGHSGGSNGGGSTHHHRGGGGGGAAAAGGPGHDQSGGNGGAGHVSDIIATDHMFGPGGRGAQYNSFASDGWGGHSPMSHGGSAGRQDHSHGNGDNGAVVLRYYIP